MPETSSFAYLRLHPHILRPATRLPFDTYVCRDEKEGLTPYKAAGQPVYVDTWKELEDSDTDLIYVADENAESCFDYVEDNLPEILKENEIPGRQAAEWVYRLACRGMESLLEEPYSTPAYARVRDLIKATAETIHRNPGTEWLMMDCAPLSYYTHSHCVNVCVLLAGLATRVLGVDERGLLSQVMLGGALHDLGKALVPPEVLHKAGPLTPAEFRLIERHPRDGVKMARPYLRQAPIAKNIIRQHHEDVCGGGYPDGRSGATINLFARAARVVDVFDALTSHRPYRNAMGSRQALATMVGQMREQFDEDILHRFINSLPARFGAQTTIPVTVKGKSARPAVHSWSDSTFRWHEEGPDEDLPIAESLLVTEPEAVAAETRQPDDADAAVMDPIVQQKLDEIEQMGNEQLRKVSQITGIMNAIGEALAGQQAGVAAKPADAAPSSAEQVQVPARAPLADAAPSSAEQVQVPARVRLADQQELSLVQSLLSVLWEVEAWRKRFAELRQEQLHVPDLRAEALACLGFMQESLAAVLRDHKVDILDQADAGGSPPKRARRA